MKKVYLIAVVFALIAGFATYWFATEINKKTSIKDAETVSVVVALQDVPKNTIITDEMLAEDSGYFTVKSCLADDATPSYISELGKLSQQVTSVDIYAGEQMNEHKIVSADSDEVGLSYKLSPGKVAYAFSAGTTSGVDGYISVGDTVDIITYEQTKDGEVKTDVAYSGLNVIRVSSAKDYDTAQSSDTKISEYNSITVEVSEKQALKLYEIENSKTFKLVLNSRKEKDEEKEKTDEAQNTEQTTAENADNQG